MPRTGAVQVAVLGARPRIAARILSTQRAALIGYWPLWENEGAVADNLEGTAARDGAATVNWGSVGVGDGHGAAGWATGKVVDIYTASLSGVFDRAEASIALWMQCATWSTTRRHLINVGKDNNNFVRIDKNTTAGQVEFEHKGGGTSVKVTLTGESDLGWLHLGMTWSEGADYVKAYRSGVLVDTATGLGTFAAAVAADRACIGAQVNDGTANWRGVIAHVAVWAGVQLSAREFRRLARR